MTTIDRSAAKNDVLWAGCEDWTGLWEVAWSLQTMWPELQGEPAKEHGRSLLQELLDEGLIFLCMFDEGNKETPVSRKKAHELLDDPKNWEPPEGFIEHVRFATTEEGAKPLFRRAEASS